MSEQALPGFEAPPPDPVPGMSRGQRITYRNKMLLERGINPATRKPFREPSGETCGTCRQCVDIGYRKSYWKCALASTSHSETSDIRKSWPACVKWEPKQLSSNHHQGIRAVYGTGSVSPSGLPDGESRA